MEAYFEGLLDAYNGVLSFTQNIYDTRFLLFLIRTAPKPIFERLKTTWAEINDSGFEISGLLNELAHIRVTMSYHSLDLHLFRSSLHYRRLHKNRWVERNDLRMKLKANRTKDKLQHGQVLETNTDTIIELLASKFRDTANLRTVASWLTTNPEILPAEAFAHALPLLLGSIKGIIRDTVRAVNNIEQRNVRHGVVSADFMPHLRRLRTLSRTHLPAMSNIYDDVKALNEELRVIRYYRIRHLSATHFAIHTECDRRLFMRATAVRQQQGRGRRLYKEAFPMLNAGSRPKLSKSALRAEVAFVRDGTCD
ncbi:hypothetical protein K491DRAFT_718567 [Lophiostoma macrostomum CBS 122681]|uniref:Uncharacterized protein n=1 Tax=Lophiostoma macrostomum CBS 122681 TaxID=1314788 RepID=A0A6A6SZ29_9PLEO|nr:hypothetical protein K491DRAFT_718567 [Lophiostoma macrostomum CBS 122681]